MEETFWKQKAHLKWMVEGDRNTRVFHEAMKRKKNKSKILSILDQGRELTDLEEIKSSAVNYYHDLLAENIPLSGSPSLTNIPAMVTS